MTELLERDVAEFRDFKVGRDILERLDDDGDELMGILGLDFFDGSASSSDSMNWYKPVSGSASGADWMRVCKGKPAEATKSFPENLSRSMTVKLIVYDCSWRMTWKIIFSWKTGFRLWRTTGVLNVFLPREVTTKGSISKDVRVTAKCGLVT